MGLAFLFQKTAEDFDAFGDGRQGAFCVAA